QTRKIERELSKRGIAPQTAPAELALDEGERIERPEPQVIDTSIPVKRKPAAKPDKLPDLEPAHFENYQLPPLSLLVEPDAGSRRPADPDELRAVQAILIDTLAQFGISVDPGDITRG